MPVDIPHSNEIKPGTWNGMITDEGRKASFSCPTCGRLGILTDHKISQNGTVKPSVVCSYECGFHENIRLEGWMPTNKFLWDKWKKEHRSVWLVQEGVDPILVGTGLAIVESKSPGTMLFGTMNDIDYYPKYARYEIHSEDDLRADEYDPLRIEKAYRRVAVTFNLPRQEVEPAILELLDEYDEEE